MLREAEFAGDAFYSSFPMGGKQIEGPSIGLDMAVARESRATICAVPVEYYETTTEWVFTAHFVDLERASPSPGSFVKRKARAYSRNWTKIADMTSRAAQSRAIRNVVLAGVPRWLTDQAKERAKDRGLKRHQQRRPGRGHGEGPEIFAGVRYQRSTRVMACWVNPGRNGPRRILPVCGAWLPSSKTARPRLRSYSPRWPRRLRRHPKTVKGKEAGPPRGQSPAHRLPPAVSCPQPPRRSQ